MPASKERMIKLHWRTRQDPFAEINHEIQRRLEENPFLNGKQVFNELQILYAGKFEDKLLRTFQRRVESWRKAKNLDESTKTWVLALLQGRIRLGELKRQYSHVLAEEDIVSLNHCILFGPLKSRNRAAAILGHLRGSATRHPRPEGAEYTSPGRRPGYRKYRKLAPKGRNMG